jgi:hypothetical protein
MSVPAFHASGCGYRCRVTTELRRLHVGVAGFQQSGGEDVGRVSALRRGLENDGGVSDAVTGLVRGVGHPPSISGDRDRFPRKSQEWKNKR